MNLLPAKKRKVLVIGHKNPDTDSICSAIAYAHLKNTLYDGGYKAARAGEVNQETRYVLKRFGMETPKLYWTSAPRWRTSTSGPSRGPRRT